MREGWREGGRKPELREGGPERRGRDVWREGGNPSFARAHANTTPTTGHSSLHDPGQEPHKDKDHKDKDFGAYTLLKHCAETVSPSGGIETTLWKYDPRCRCWRRLLDSRVALLEEIVFVV